MIFKRKLYKKLIEWKNTKNRKPLIISGARQVGKTVLVNEFAKNEYGKDNYILIDFRKEKSVHVFFDGDFDIDEIILNLKIKYRNNKFEPGKTLLIFDEIQDCPNARSSLKYFCLDGRYDVICTGSLLGVKNYRTIKNSRGIPVGYEQYLTLYPMDFEEFLWAININSEIISSINEYIKKGKSLPIGMHELLLNEFKKYIWVGGMPNVVKKFIETNDHILVREEQRSILMGYQSDFGTHLNDNLEINVDNFARIKIQQCYDSIPKQLAKENQKFQYSVIKNGAKSREYQSSIDWLCDYGLTSKCYNLSALENPLDQFVETDEYKIFVMDTGLYISMLDDNIIDELMLNKLFIGKGAIFENIFADAALKAGKKLYYYKKDSGLEIDFITSINSEVNLIEIKAKSGTCKSSKTILNNKEKYHVNSLIKFTASNININENIKNYPYYLISFILN